MNEVKPNIPPNDMVMVTKSEFDGMAARLERLEAKSELPIAKRVKEHFAILRKWNDKIVVDDIRDIKEKWLVEPDGNKTKKLMCSLVLFDGKETKLEKDIDCLDFVKNGEKIKVKLLETMRKEVEELNGTLPVVEVNDFSSKVVGETENIVTKEEISYIIEMPDGTKMNIKSNALNI